MRPGSTLVAVLAVLAAAGGIVAAGGNAPGAEANPSLRDFDTVWAAFDRSYPYFGLKGVDWEAVRDSLRPRAARAEDGASRLALLTDLLATLDDVHATLVSPGGTVHRPVAPPPPSNWDPDRWLSEMEQMEWHPQGSAWGWGRAGRFGYLAISSWDPRHLSLAAVDRALESLGDRDGLLIDVRMNGGGHDGLALGLAARFASRRRIVQYVRHRTRDGLLAPPEPRTIRPSRTGRWRKPVVVLAGRGSLSSTETFVAAMAELPRVIVAGDTTGGSSGYPVERGLSGGWRVRVPRLAVLTADGAVVEGRGIAPDVSLASATVEAERDGVLVEALAVLERHAPGGRPDAY